MKSRKELEKTEVIQVWFDNDRRERFRITTDVKKNIILALHEHNFTGILSIVDPFGNMTKINLSRVIMIEMPL